MSVWLITCIIISLVMGTLTALFVGSITGPGGEEQTVAELVRDKWFYLALSVCVALWFGVGAGAYWAARGIAAMFGG